MDREKVIEGLCGTIGIIHGYIPKRYWGYGEQACRDAIELLKQQPEIVRCKDCKHQNWVNAETGCIVCKFGRGTNSPDWFCADGERKET